jgi:hypothetical protein
MSVIMFIFKRCMEDAGEDDGTEALVEEVSWAGMK